MKKKTLTKDSIIEMYMEYCLSINAKPKSVYEFAKASQFPESEFYEYFGNLETIDKVIFKKFLDLTVDLLDKNAEYAHYEGRNKLLSFYYTFFEILTANRSYVILSLNEHKNQLKNITQLSRLRTAFKHYINENIHLDAFPKLEKFKDFQEKAITETAWVQLLLTLKFWLEDGSPKFEKTDIFIEKSINTAFDLMHTKPLESLFDFGKFIFKERMQPTS